MIIAYQPSQRPPPTIQSHPETLSDEHWKVTIKGLLRIMRDTHIVWQTRTPLNMRAGHRTRRFSLFGLAAFGILLLVLWFGNRFRDSRERFP
jgi:hypothetical protein